jgi:hypothetical protein
LVTIRIVLTVLGTALGAASTVPYLLATVRGSTRPRIVTWLTWSLLTGVAGAASASASDYPAAAFSLVGTLATALVVAAGLRYGDRTVTRLDAACVALVLVGFVLWIALDLPGIAVAAACLIDLVGLVPTLVHGWRRPHEETPVTFALIAAGGLCAAVAAWGTWTVTALAYPVYVALSMGACWAVVVLRGRAAEVTAYGPPAVTTQTLPGNVRLGAVRLRPAIPPATVEV